MALSRKCAVILLTLALIFTACIQEQTTPKTEVEGGVRALEISLKPVSRDIIMCQQTDVLTTLHNAGTANIERGEYNIITEPQVLKPITPQKGEISLEGRTKYSPGETLKMTISLKNNGLAEQLQNYQTPLIFQACYPYQTKANIPVCIDPDIADTIPNKPCRAEPIDLRGGQGAPVAITQVDQVMIPTNEGIRPTFLIHVQNQGGGRIVDLAALEFACGSARASTRLKPLVKINANLAGKELECAPENAEIGPDTTIISCTSKTTYPKGAGTISSILTANIEYGYINTKTLTFNIKRLPGQTSC
ncbi:hypothetical protein D6825_01050 [Candidatus Woesearchaeota archaeon]|nr:MAG: hypothetical protein D6825_01050 [Candidatus Woesearchaeota archaeon]